MKTQQKEETTTEIKKMDALRLSNAESNRLTRDCIRKALLYLLRENNYDQITVTQIIRRSGVSRAGFYRNYDSKDEVIQEIFNLIPVKLGKHLAELTPGEDLSPWLFELFSTALQDKETILLLLDARRIWEIPQKMGSSKQPAPCPKDEQNLTPPEQYYLAMVRSSIPAIFFTWAKNGMRETPEEMAELASRMLSWAPMAK